MSTPVTRSGASLAICDAASRNAASATITASTQALTHVAQPLRRLEVRETERQLGDDDPERVTEREGESLGDTEQ